MAYLHSATKYSVRTNVISYIAVICCSRTPFSSNSAHNMAAKSGYSRFGKFLHRRCLLSRVLRNTGTVRNSSTQKWVGRLGVSDGTVRARVDQMVQKHKQLVERLSSEDMQKTTQSEHRKLMKMVSKLQPLADLVAKWEKKRKEVAEYREMVQTQKEDASMQTLFEDAIAVCLEEMEELEAAILAAVVPDDESDESSAILEVRPGAGGREAALFTGELFQMYLSYSQFRRWKVEVLSQDMNESGGVKEASASIEGPGVYRALKHERGVHRIQRVPVTESHGRLHTSTSVVVVLPQPEDIESNLNMKDVRIDTFRASGAGGQHVNTTDSAVRVTHIPSGTVVSIQSERSQHKNRSKALRVLRAKLFDLQLQASLEEQSQKRKEQIGTAERSERIRTYNFPQDRVTDHRLNDSVHGLRDFMSGEDSLHDMVEQLTKQEDLRRLEDALRDQHDIS